MSIYLEPTKLVENRSNEFVKELKFSHHRNIQCNGSNFLFFYNTEIIFVIIFLLTLVQIVWRLRHVIENRSMRNGVFF